MKVQLPLIAALALALIAGPVMAGDTSSNANSTSTTTSDDGKTKPKTPAPPPRGGEGWRMDGPNGQGVTFPPKGPSSSSSSSGSSFGSGRSSSSSRDEQEEIRAAVREGRILPLTDILAAVAKKAPGTVIAVQLETEDGRRVYKVDVLTQGGRRLRAEVDAATAFIRKIENR